MLWATFKDSEGLNILEMINEFLITFSSEEETPQKSVIFVSFVDFEERNGLKEA